MIINNYVGHKNRGKKIIFKSMKIQQSSHGDKNSCGIKCEVDFILDLKKIKLGAVWAQNIIIMCKFSTIEIFCDV